MGRRTFLRTAALAVTGGIAGCSALQGSSDETSEPYQLTTADHLAIAVGELNTVALAIREYQADENSRSAAFDDSQPRERLDAARNSVATAEDTAETERATADAEAVGDYADAMEGTVDAVTNLNGASSGLETARELLQADAVDTDEASSTLGDARTASANAVEARDTAVAALERADGDRLERLDAEYDAMNSGVDRLSGFVTGVHGLTVGYDDQVAGIERLQTAENQVNDEDFSAATDAFATARDRFEDAAAAFTDRIEGAAESLVADLETGDRQSRSLAHLGDGYVSLLAGQTDVSNAQTDIENEAYDAARESLTSGGDAAATALDRFETGASIIDEFADQFETAKTRAAAMTSLADGYTSVLDAREHVEMASERIDAGDYEAARSALDDASTASAEADETFASGESGDDLFVEEFDRARSRAQGLNSLSTGYVSLIDARDHVTDAEAHIEAESYDAARESLTAGSEAAESADATFASGQESTGEFFDAEFERARSRATAVAALSDGYATMTDARQQASRGQSALDDREFDAAADHFASASETLGDAESTFAEGRAATDTEFETEFERATCRVTHLKNAVDHFESAAEAGSDGDRRTARDQQSEGEADLERFESC